MKAKVKNIMKTVINWRPVNRCYPNLENVSIDGAFVPNAGWKPAPNRYFCAHNLLCLKNDGATMVNLEIETQSEETIYADFSIKELLLTI